MRLVRSPSSFLQWQPRPPVSYFAKCERLLPVSSPPIVTTRVETNRACCSRSLATKSSRPSAMLVLLGIQSVSIGDCVLKSFAGHWRQLRTVPFELLRTDDVTANAAVVAKRWHDSRAQRGKELARIEGKANFAGLQEFLWRVHVVSIEGRLSRYAHLARKPEVARAGSSRRGSDGKRRNTQRLN